MNASRQSYQCCNSYFKGHILICGMYRGAKLLEHAMKIVVKVFDERFTKVVAIDDMQFGFMPSKGTVDTVFILRRIQEKYLAKQYRFYMCFVDLEKAIEKVPRKVVELAMTKKKEFHRHLLEQWRACIMVQRQR